MACCKSGIECNGPDVSKTGCVGKIEQADVERALDATKPTGSCFEEKYQQFTASFGTT